MIPEISVILPTYNRESLLSFSIGAILNQTISDFELIIVNDGSQDHTSEIIDQYARQDSRIVVVNKPNGGLGSARNAGIERARGIYITFIDDDDSIVPNYLELLLQRDLANFDLVIDSYSNQLDEDAPTPIHFPTRKLTSRQESLQFIFDDLQNVPYCFLL